MDAIKLWAPDHENDTITYYNNIKKWSHIELDRIINSLTETELENLAQAIKRQEGSRQGIITWKLPGEN